MIDVLAEMIAALPASRPAQRELCADLSALSSEAAFLPSREWADWCEAVGLRLRLLGTQLRSPFELERDAGLLEDAQAHGAACEGLLHEQQSLLVRIDALAMEAALCSEPPLWAGALRQLLDDIVRHEERQSLLLRRLLDERRRRG